MNLDDLERFKQLDTLNMLGEIDNLPDQLAFAYQLGMKHDLPDWKNFRQVVIAGMGGSAIGADLLAAYCASLAPLPVSVHRDYSLPVHARGEESLVICSSHSGNTEETLDAFESARKAECRIVVVCTGGELAKRAKENNIPIWTFDHAGQPRAAVGFSFGLLLAMFQRLGFLSDQSKEMQDAVASMKRTQQHLKADVPAVKNPAKRYAGQLMGRWVTFMGSGLLSVVARRWKGQINEVAKAGANFEFIPEADHNTLAGTMNPQETLNAHTMTLFLRAPSDHPRNRLRSDLTRKAFMLEGMNTDYIDARGETPLAHMWTSILFGDYMAYYLAMGYGVDPTPIQALVEFKEAMKEAK
ncbi:MAG: bifunctional phosphoglucose/phosphomannose isomerase [Anaerolineae bacterium]|nr:bifunctional phosphoglucose/phosphomannose isomerase [Anaerolineae bacterium]MBL8104455.1 bifunctional phosphoglucose/phosphomannose isomerase [Anaerolineales bacterium]MCC7189529.1 bifunctional phosphoglucose/phosphomannose isomerase [Anaerolineales bacterium]